MLRYRLRTYAPNGALSGALPSPMGISLGVPLNDMPALQLDYHPRSTGASILANPCEVAVEFLDPSTGDYAEPPGCRFLNLRVSGDRLQTAAAAQYTMPSYGWQLRKVRNINTAAFDEEGRRSFLAASPGEILATLINEAKGRGNIPQLLIDFDGNEDSDGQEWDNALTISLDAGQDVWSILDAFTRQGMCDWRMNGRTLQVYNPDSFLDRDLTNDPAVILRPYRDHIAEPNDSTYEELASKILIHGDESAFLEVSNPSAMTPWGEWEEYHMQAGVEDTGTMTLLAQRILEGRAQARIQMTRQVIVTDGSPLPFFSYRPGDHILSTDEEGNQNTSLRIHQITVSTGDQNTAEVHLTLNDRFMEREVRNQRALNSLTGFGGPGGTGGSGGTPTPPPTEDTRQPAAPQGLVLLSSTYIDEEGFPVGQVTATWAPVTESTGGAPMAVDRYEVQARIQSVPDIYNTRTFVAHPQVTAFVSPLDVEQTYSFRVRAVGQNGRSGPWSASQVVLVQRDLDPPPAPSVPILSSRLGTIRVEWDGLDADGLSMPVDFNHIQVEMADNGTGPWQNVGDIFTGGSAVIVTDLPYGGEFWFRFLAMDSSRNQSDPSDSDSIEVVRVEGPDIEANSITANHIEAGSITAEKIAAYAITADRLAVGEARNLITDSTFVDAELSAHRADVATGPPNTASTVDWAYLPDDGIFEAQLNATTLPAVAARLPLFNNLVINPNLAAGSTLPSTQYAAHVDTDFGNLTGRFQINIFLSSGTWTPGANVTASLVTRYYDRNGNSISAAIIAGTGTYTEPTGGFITQQSGGGSVIPPNAVACIPYIQLQFNGHEDTNVVVQVAVPFAAQASNTVMIQNGAITAAKVVANAINADHIQANALTVKHTVTGSFFQTATGGQRITMGPQNNFIANTPAVRFWASNDTNTSTVMWNVDDAGTGGWTPGSFVTAGPEVTRNSTGRVDMNFLIGGGLRLSTSFVNMSNRHAGINNAVNSSELALLGSFPRGDELGHNYTIFRVLVTSFQIGSLTWALDNGWVYRAAINPYTASGTAAPRYGSQRARSSSGFSWIVNDTVGTVELLTWRGAWAL